MYEKLIEKLETYVKVKKIDVVKKEIDIDDMTFMKLRDNLMGMGTILEEDFENQIYVISMAAGIANMNTAVVGIELHNHKAFFAAYAREGLIKQSTADKAIKRIEKAFE